MSENSQDPEDADVHSVDNLVVSVAVIAMPPLICFDVVNGTCVML